MAASSVTRIQLLVTSSVNPAKTGSCVGSIRVCVCVCWGCSGDIDRISLLLPQEPRSITSSLPSRQLPSQRLAVAFKAGEALGLEAVGGWELVWGGFLPGNHEAAASSQLTLLYC